MLKIAKKFPLIRIVVLGQLALLAHRHIGALTPQERRRLVELARKPHKLTPRERRELRALAAKLEPGTFAKSAARTVSPLGGTRAKRR
jgi:hypothetical protein